MKNSILLATVAILLSTAVSASEIVRTGIVLRSEPIYTTRTESTPSTSCKTIDVPIYGNSNKTSNAGEGAFLGMLLGGIGGKVIGGNDKGAAAGAILGGIIGADKAQKNTTRQIVGYNQEQRCTTVYTNKKLRTLDGYFTVVEVRELDYFRYDFVSNTQYAQGQELQTRIKLEVK